MALHHFICSFFVYFETAKLLHSNLVSSPLKIQSITDKSKNDKPLNLRHKMLNRSSQMNSKKLLMSGSELDSMGGIQKDYSTMARGFNEKMPLNCFVYVNNPSHNLQSAKLECYLDTIGCITWLNVTAVDTWTNVYPPDPIKNSVCLSKLKANARVLGSCFCNQNNICKCYCLGALCNTE